MVEKAVKTMVNKKLKLKLLTTDIDILKVFYSSKVKKNNFHPTQKPVALFEYFIKTYTNEGDTVLDNCIGSGTTAIACLNTKRNFIGFENNQEYFEKAIDRIEKHAIQTYLF